MHGISLLHCPIFIYLFGVLRRFQHCTGHITTGSWKGRGNQYIEFARVLYCKLPTNGKQLPVFPHKALTGIKPRPQRWEARVLPLPYKIAHKPCLQSFQFKVIHRIINRIDKLYKWKIIENPKCSYCTSVDTIEHHFYYYRINIEFWRKLSHAIYEVFNLNIHFTVL